MLNFLSNYGLFLLKAITIVISVLLIVMGIVAAIAKNKIKPKEKISVDKLNDKFDEMKSAIEQATSDKEALKKLKKEKKKSKKELKKSTAKKDDSAITQSKKRIFVLNFEGDIKASAVETLREEITAILTSIQPSDEVLVRLESSGGTIHGYGLAASQLQRIRQRKIPLTISVDKVAASGGYMMACVADKILAAPFAIIGSIGVLFQLPNFNNLLERHHVTFEQITAGEYKRTMSLFGKNTSKGRDKMQEEVEEAHDLFKKFVSENRPNIAISEISTGEHWYGSKALDLRLVDEIITSDDYLFTASKNADIYEVTYTIKKNLMEKVSFLLHSGVAKLMSFYL